MMLAIALSKDRVGAVGGSAGQAQEMWKTSTDEIHKVSLDNLKRMKDDADLRKASQSSGDVGRAPEPTAGGDGVVSAQNTLEELGFGSPDPGPQAKGKAKAKAKAPAATPPPAASDTNHDRP